MKTTQLLVLLFLVLFSFRVSAQSWQYGPQRCSDDVNFARISVDALVPTSCGGGTCTLPQVHVYFNDCGGGPFEVGALVLTGFKFQTQSHLGVGTLRVDVSNQLFQTVGSDSELYANPVASWVENSGTDDMGVWLHFEAVAMRKAAARIKRVPLACTNGGGDDCASVMNVANSTHRISWLGLTRFTISTLAPSGFVYANTIKVRGLYDAGGDLKLFCKLSNNYTASGLTCDADLLYVMMPNAYSPILAGTHGNYTSTQTFNSSKDSTPLVFTNPVFQPSAFALCGVEGFSLDASRVGPFPYFDKWYQIWAGVHGASCQADPNKFYSTMTAAQGAYSLPGGNPMVLHDLYGSNPYQETVWQAPFRAR